MAQLLRLFQEMGVKNRMRIEKMFWLKKDCEQALKKNWLERSVQTMVGVPKQVSA